MRNHWTEIEKYLEDQKIAQELIGELRDFHMRYEVEDQVKERVEKPDILFYGKKILEMSIAALLQGDNLLLSGAKATGKNVLCNVVHIQRRREQCSQSEASNICTSDEECLQKCHVYSCKQLGL